jgi:hypothetical protein
MKKRIYLVLLVPVLLLALLTTADFVTMAAAKAASKSSTSQKAMVQNPNPVPAYCVRLNMFHINNTRAIHEDTDYVMLTTQVNDQPQETAIYFAGDVNNGDHFVGLRVGPFNVGAQDTLTIKYVILNKGHDGDLDTVLKALKIAADATASIKGGWGGAIATAIGSALDLVYPNRDGIVAVDTITISGTELARRDNLAGESGYFTEAPRQYLGQIIDQNHPSDSDYTVSWSTIGQRLSINTSRDITITDGALAEDPIVTTDVSLFTECSPRPLQVTWQGNGTFDNPTGEFSLVHFDLTGVTAHQARSEHIAVTITAANNVTLNASIDITIHVKHGPSEPLPNAGDRGHGPH